MKLVRKAAVLALQALFFLGIAVGGNLLLSPSPPGPIARYLFLDLHRLLPLLYLVAFGSIGILAARSLAPKAWRDYLAIAISGSSQVAFVYYALNSLPALLRDVAAEARYVDLVARLEDGALRSAQMDIPLGALMALLGAYRLSDHWSRTTGRSWLSPALAAVTAAVWGMGLWLMLRSLEPLWEGLPPVGLVTLGGSLSLALFHLASYGRAYGAPLLAGLAGWADASRLRTFLLGSVIAFYLATLRPAMYEHLKYAVPLEWAALGLVLVLLYRRTVAFLNRSRAAEAEEGQWQEWLNHRQVVTVTPNPDMEYGVNVQKEFRDSGVREPLLVYLTSILVWNGVPQARMAQVVRPLVQHRDRHSAWIPTRWHRRRADELNRRKRAQLLQETMESARAAIRSGGALMAHPV